MARRGGRVGLGDGFLGSLEVFLPPVCFHSSLGFEGEGLVDDSAILFLEELVLGPTGNILDSAEVHDVSVVDRFDFLVFLASLLGLFLGSLLGLFLWRSLGGGGSSFLFLGRHCEAAD